MRPFSIRRLLWAGPLVTLLAILINLLFYAVTKAFGEQFIMPLDGSTSNLGPMPILMPVVVTLVPGLLATIFFGLLIRFSRSPVIVFLPVCVAALILSFGGPFYLPAATLATKIILTVMNVFAGVIITGGILLMSHNTTIVP
ncbi:MAG TPA: DUF6069 family protein [Anaerolineaceae bacterium]